MLTAVSLFAGIGGIDLALQHAGIKVVAAVEIDKAARGVIADQFPNTRLYEDVTRVHAFGRCRDAAVEPSGTGLVDDPVRDKPAGGRGYARTGASGDDRSRCGDCLPRVDSRQLVLTGGWPCQGNSVAGRRGGMADPRSGLWVHVARLLAELRPAWFLGENVPGLLSVNDGRDFGVVLTDLADCGMGYAWRVLDAQHFGVPQRRRRIIIVGCAGDRTAPVQVLLEPESSGRDTLARRATGTTVAGTLGSRVGGSRTTDLDGHGGNPHVAHSLTAEGADASEDGTGRDTPLIGFHLTQDPISGDVIPAVGANSMGNGVLSATAVRRLTPLECERLQGFPDGWTLTFGGRAQADSARYQQLGNAVAVPVIEWVARRIVAVHAAQVGAA